MSNSPFQVRKTAKITDVKQAEAPVASDNFQTERLVGMTFNMPESWHTEFKVTAATRGISMRELLIQSFEAWKKQ